MENLKRELKILQAIDGVPLPPQKITSVLSDEQSRVKLPDALALYLEKAKLSPKLDKDGKISHKEYLGILEKHNIATIGHPVRRYVVVSNDQVRLNKTI